MRLYATYLGDQGISRVLVGARNPNGMEVCPVWTARRIRVLSYGGFHNGVPPFQDGLYVYIYIYFHICIYNGKSYSNGMMTGGTPISSETPVNL